ncbi:RDD family protein [Pedococcus aerophilus]|uniref:RDD family protein n=1 Tax=Pedococcus aerophilus TaxID=436356 RepID=A0ABN3URM8_9MICO
MTEQPPTPYLQPATGHPSGGFDRSFDGPWGPLADWGTRVGASIIDSLVALVAAIPYVIGFVLIITGAGSGYDTTTIEYEPDDASRGLVVTGIVLIAVGFLLALGLVLWNRVLRQGRTGQSIGKKVLGIKLVDEHTGQPVGPGMAFVREIAHTLDGFAYIGYLWPLWDSKRQTFADKVVKTLVVRVPSS